MPMECKRPTLAAACFFCFWEKSSRAASEGSRIVKKPSTELVFFFFDGMDRMVPCALLMEAEPAEWFAEL